MQNDVRSTVRNDANVRKIKKNQGCFRCGGIPGFCFDLLLYGYGSYVLNCLHMSHGNPAISVEFCSSCGTDHLAAEVAGLAGLGDVQLLIAHFRSLLCFLWKKTLSKESIFCSGSLFDQSQILYEWSLAGNVGDFG